jgi:Domain of unknown function (DUF5710)
MDDDSWKTSKDENIYEMYVAHGSAGFWVRRITWGGSCARVVRVGKITRPGPYFGSPSVLMDVYSLGGQLKDEAAPLPAAGTYKTWRKIEPPDWAGSANLRALDDPRLDVALAQLDRKRHKAPGMMYANDKVRVRLNVTYQQKDVAKNLGARWDPGQKFWWLPADNHAAINRAKELGFLPAADVVPVR